MDGGGQHIHHITGPDQIEQRRVGEMQRHDARVRPGRRFGEPWPQQPHIGEHLAAAGGTGQGRPDERVQIRLGTVGNRCGRAVFEPQIGGAQFDAGSQVPGGDDDLGAVTLRIGAQRRDGGQNDECARRDAAGRHGARPVRPHPCTSRLNTDGFSDSPMPPR